jgi:hypothetical protein
VLGEGVGALRSTASAAVLYSRFRYKITNLFSRNPKHKIARKPMEISDNLLVQSSGLHAIECGKVGINDDLFASKEQDLALDAFRGNN